jgi:hypothetical protein
MAKFPSFPTVFDSCKTVSISDLNKWGYLKPNQDKTGTITWSRQGVKTGSISIEVNTKMGNCYLLLDYKCNDKPISYQVQLITKPSNLGKGEVWFFICPKTGKFCRKLYLIDTYFLHRSAFKGYMYEKQIQSKKYRAIEKRYGAYFDSDQLYTELYKKYFKRYYAGKPTKRFIKLSRRLKESDSISHLDIERLMVS